MPQSTKDLLTVESLYASYGSGDVVRDANLVVRTGEIVGLIGRNGAGKTTTLRAISGKIRHMRGQVALGEEILRGSPHMIARRGVIQVPEGRELMVNMTVWQNLRVGAVAVGKELDEDFEDLLDAFFQKLKPLLKRKAGLLSGGEQQLVALLRGLAAKPRILLVDELSLGLSPKAVSEVTSSLLDASRSRGLSLLVVDQNVYALRDVCDRLYYMNDGVIKEIEDINEIDNLMESIYFR